MRKYKVNTHKPGPVDSGVPVRRRRRRVFGAWGGGWEWGGCLQSLLWLLLTLLLLFLLFHLLRGCSGGGRAGSPDVTWETPHGRSGAGDSNESVFRDGDEHIPLPERSVYPGSGWRTPREGGVSDPEYRVLPGPEDNRIAPPPADGGVKDPDNMKYVSPDRLNVILRSEGDDAMERWARKFKSLYPDPDHSINSYNEKTHLLQITVPESEREAIKRGLNAQMPEFDFLIFNNDVIRRDRTSPFPSLRRLFLRLNEKNWYLDAVQAVDAWEIEQGDPSVTIAVVDNFFDLSHPMFENKTVFPYSVSRNDDNVSARFRNKGDAHGTHVAATAAGNPVQEKGVSGIAPGCKLMPVMIGTANNGYLDIMSTLEGILYAIYNGADVINVSAGVAFTDKVKKLPVEAQREVIHTFGKTEEYVWNYVFDAADRHNAVIVWAAGNDDILSGLDPSKRNDKTIRVSAVDHRLRKSDFSNFGVFGPDEYYSTVSAPGEDIYNAFPNGRFGFLSGTSMAAPIVTGAVALMKSVDKNLTTEEIISILRKTGKPVGEDIGPLIQIKDALTAVRDGFLNYDDVLENPESIVGLWKSTTPLFNTHSNAPIILYLKFFSSKEGQVIIHENDSGNDFTAPLSVSVSSSGIVIKQLSPATNPTVPPGYVRYYYHCSPDDDRSVQCTASPQENVSAGNVSFNLRKII